MLQKQLIEGKKLLPRSVQVLYIQVYKTANQNKNQNKLIYKETKILKTKILIKKTFIKKQ